MEELYVLLPYICLKLERHKVLSLHWNDLSPGFLCSIMGVICKKNTQNFYNVDISITPHYWFPFFLTVTLENDKQILPIILYKNNCYHFVIV